VDSTFDTYPIPSLQVWLIELGVCHQQFDCFPRPKFLFTMSCEQGDYARPDTGYVSISPNGAFWKCKRLRHPMSYAGV
jgi:hypothetical protein